MDSALASQDIINLSLCVALTGAQVGALTHDIVWMKNSVIGGQTIRVPTSYLIQADAHKVRSRRSIPFRR